MSFPICAKCVEGFILPGTPSGSMQYNDTAYFAPAPTPESESEGSANASKKVAVVLLTDAFGLPLVNSKLIADRFAKEVGCDVWVPDMFNGNPPLGIYDLKGLPERPGESLSFLSMLSLGWVFIRALPALLMKRPTKGAVIAERFIEKIKAEKGYERIGVTGYCYGGTVAIILGASTLINSAVINHPGNCTIEQIKAIKVPSSWQCAEEDMSFKPAFRNEAEMVFKGREKDSKDFVEFEFADHPGTVHGFAARPNLAIPEAKEGFEKAFAAAVAWFKQTLF